MRRLILVTVLILSSACTTVPTSPKLPLPPPLELRPIPRADVQCLSDSAYELIVLRDRLQAARIVTLENIIKATH